MQNGDTELSSKPVAVPNPKRVAAGKRNRLKRHGLSPEGREKLRLAALRTKPWQHATGPKTPVGKAKAAANGKTRQSGLVSVRELKADLRCLRALFKEMKASRDSVGV